MPVDTITHKVSGSTTSGGSVVCIPANVAAGGSSSCSILPAPNYKLSTLTDNGTSVLTNILNTSYTIVTVTGDHAIAATFSLIAPTKAGDCDNSGTVTIAEVQSAINMFLGLKTVEACVNLDGVSGVSIAEVQKVINSFLGL
jgi:hypothetical protein